jgi:antitoxin component HigA of HigAB toxin-antitoxin module
MARVKSAGRPVRPLRSKADYEAALDTIERYFDNEPKPGTPEADRFDLLALVIEDYETGSSAEIERAPDVSIRRSVAASGEAGCGTAA